MSDGKRSAAMQSQQQLHEAVSNQFMQRQQFLVGFVNGISVGAGLDARARFQRIGCLAKDRVFHGFPSDVPQRDKAVHSCREAYGEYAPVAGRSMRLEVKIERPVKPVGSK